MKKERQKEKEIKCVSWDLDGTLWDGILAEGDEVRLKPGIEEILKSLDERGILLSIVSRNDYDLAMKKLEGFGFADLFLFPEIGWNAKSVSVDRIRKNLNIQDKAIMFVDDEAFEREEVQHVHPDINCMDAVDYAMLPEHPLLQVAFGTKEAGQRRFMYKADKRREEAESEFAGPRRDFLFSLNVHFTISQAKEEDLARAQELTVRTNQLNATGQTYSFEELQGFLRSDRHELFICELEDRFGSYGKIGLALVETDEKVLRLRLLLMSCRVMNRGLGTVLLSHIMQMAKAQGKKLWADFRDTGSNRMMYIALKFAGFQPLNPEEREGGALEADLTKINPFPPYMKVTIR
jgi:FkbH-like protein